MQPIHHGLDDGVLYRKHAPEYQQQEKYQQHFHDGS
jgi:hypothetical protein